MFGEYNMNKSWKIFVFIIGAVSLLNGCQPKQDILPTNKIELVELRSTDYGPVLRSVFDQHLSKFYTEYYTHIMRYEIPTQKIRLHDSFRFEMKNLKGATPIGNNIYHYQLTKDDKHLIAVTRFGLINIWNTESSEPIHIFQTKLTEEQAKKNYSVNNLEVSLDSRKFATTSFAVNDLQVWDINSGKIIQNFNFEDENSQAKHIVFNSTGTQLAIYSYSKGTIVWDIEADNVLFTLQHSKKKSVKRILFSPNDRYIMAKFLTSLSVWDAQTGKIIHHFDIKKEKPENLYPTDYQRLQFANFSPNGGKILVVTGWRTKALKGLDRGYNVKKKLRNEGRMTSIRVYSAQTGEKLYEFPTELGYFEEAIFSPDGTMIVTVFDDKLLFWDARDGSFLANFEGKHKAPVVFSKDSKQIIIKKTVFQINKAGE